METRPFSVLNRARTVLLYCSQIFRQRYVPREHKNKDKKFMPCLPLTRFFGDRPKPAGCGGAIDEMNALSTFPKVHGCSAAWLCRLVYCGSPVQSVPQHGSSTCRGEHRIRTSIPRDATRGCPRPFREPARCVLCLFTAMYCTVLSEMSTVPCPGHQCCTALEFLPQQDGRYKGSFKMIW